MFQSFDKYNRYEIPVLTLCNPNRKELGQLSQPINFNVSLKFNSVSEISFKYPYQIKTGLLNPFYNKIVTKRVLYCDELGYFIIQESKEYNDGINRYKEVTALSAEIELNSKKISLFDGVNPFYDPVNPDKSWMGMIIKSVPNWKIGTIDADLWSVYRTFEIPDATIYNFMMKNMEESYQCIFLFDTVERTINAYTLKSIVKYTDIFMSYDNLSKDTEIEEVTDDIVTVLGCYGDSDLDISGVNPLGTPYLYNFKYFEPMMTNGLVEALHRWNDKISSYSDSYKNTLVQLKAKNTELIAANTTLVDLKEDVVATEGVQSAQIQQGIDKSDPSAYQSTVNKLEQQRAAVTRQQAIVDSLDAQAKQISEQIKNINIALRLENNFTQDQLKELDNYRYESTYQDDSFITTDIMSLVEKQDMQQALFDQSVELLKRLAQPRYNFTIKSVNFLFMSLFQKYISQLQLGSCVNVEISDDDYMQPILLEIDFCYDDPDSFSLKFGNRYRLNDPTWEFSDLYSQATSSASRVDFNGNAWNEWLSHQNQITNFVNSALDLTKNELLNNTATQTMTMNENGLKGKVMLPDGSYSGKQVWLTNNILAFSDDGFRTVKIAIGDITLPNGGKAYGMAADVLIGKAIFGSNMTISNEGGTMTFDSTGFTMYTLNGRNKITMYPGNGITMQSFDGSQWVNKFSLDANGNAYFAGHIECGSGHIGGFIIEANRLYSVASSYNWHGFTRMIDLRTDGTGRIGLLAWDANNAWFNGNIYAKNLDAGGMSHDKVDNNFDQNVLNYVDRYGGYAKKSDIPKPPDMSKYVTMDYWNNKVPPKVAHELDDEGGIKDDIFDLSQRVSRLERGK